MIGIDIIEQHIADTDHVLLHLLLQDKTTRGYIKWGSNNYEKYGEAYHADQPIQPELIIGENTEIIQPRIAKAKQEKIERTRSHAEVFTPLWVCNQQNNQIDEAWFHRKNVFNTAEGKRWQVRKEPIMFSKRKTWKHYVDARRLEVACGEAPYLVSRYDNVSGELIPVNERIGLLDRKLRVVTENILTEAEWLYWAMRAVQSCYAYDYQGDNVLLARENILASVVETMEYYLDTTPSIRDLKKIANVIAWNVWQMDGLTMTVPFSHKHPEVEQLSFFGLNNQKLSQKDDEGIPCRIFDWRAKCSLEFRSL